MAFTSGTNWDVQTGGDSTNNGGGFDTGVTGFPTDGAATSATGNSPVFTSASYSFVAGDVGAWVYIKSGTNWTSGWYQIASVASSAATLSAAVGAANLGSGPNTTAGCATTASPTGATWGIDYSQSTTVRISFTDLVIDATTNTKFTSSANPVGKNFIGNIVAITAGTGFTVQRVAIVSTSSTVATCDKSLGTTSSTGGTGKLGGALATIDAAISSVATITVGQTPNVIHVKSGTYTRTTTLTISCNYVTIVGYASSRNDRGTKPLITTSTNSLNLINITGSGQVFFSNISFSHTATTRGILIASGGTYPYISLENCTVDGGTWGIIADNSAVSAGNVILYNTEIKNCTTGGAASFFSMHVMDSYIHDNGGPGLKKVSNQCDHFFVYNSLITGNTVGILAAGYSPGTTGNNNVIPIGMYVLHSTVAFNTSDGVQISSFIVPVPLPIQVESSIIYGNGGYGINSGVLNPLATITMKNNAWGSNTSGNVNNWKTGLNSQTLTANPFTATGDYSLNSTAGGGALCKTAGYPGVFPGGGNTGYPDIGAVQSQGTSGGGSGTGNYGFIG